MKFSQEDSSRSGRERKESGIFLTSRHVSWVVSVIILACFFIFIAGYFLGKKKAVEKFYRKVGQESFSDHIYYSMCSMYDKSDLQQGAEGEENTSAKVVAVEQDVSSQDTSIAISSTPAIEKDISSVVESEVSNKIQEEKAPGHFYAELIGFGTHRAARKFADKLKKENIAVSVKKRKSKTARGKVIVWYQVITQKFSDKNDLIALVDDISAQERLKDVRIVSC